MNPTYSNECQNRAWRQPTTQELLNMAKAENQRLENELREAKKTVAFSALKRKDVEAENQRLRDYIIRKVLEEG